MRVTWVKTEGGEGWGRVTAVDAHGLSYVLSWEPAASKTGADACVILMLSCGPGNGAVRIGELAQAVRKAAEGSI